MFVMLKVVLSEIIRRNQDNPISCHYASTGRTFLRVVIWHHRSKIEPTAHFQTSISRKHTVVYKTHLASCIPPTPFNKRTVDLRAAHLQHVVASTSLPADFILQATAWLVRAAGEICETLDELGTSSKGLLPLVLPPPQ